MNSHTPGSAAWLSLRALDRALVGFLQSQSPCNDPRHIWLAALTSYQLGRGHACLDVRALTEQPASLLGWTAEQARALPTDWLRALDHWTWAQGEGSPLILAGPPGAPRVYLRRAHAAEQLIRSCIAQRLQQTFSVTGLQQYLQDLFGPADTQALDWQRVACALATRSALTLITGGPGTGKTTTVARLLALLSADARERGLRLRVRLAAPTGKAASRLGASIQAAMARSTESMDWDGPPAPQTLHSLLNFIPDAPLRELPNLACDVVVVDEASMIDLEMMARLLAAVPLRTRLILLGDKDQLASVEAGAVMAQLCEEADAGHYSPETVDWLRTQTGLDVSAWAAVDAPAKALAQHTVMLRHSRRFDAQSSIGQWAQAVNAGDLTQVKALYASSAQSSGTTGPQDVQILLAQKLPNPKFTQTVREAWGPWLQALKAVPSACSNAQALELLTRFADFQVLCALRSGPWGVDPLNRLITRLLGFGPEDWYIGRPVMLTRNDPNLKLMNGDVGLCLPTESGLRVAFAQEGRVRWVLPSRLDAVETVWAMTVHKSQGSEFEHVMLVLPDATSPVMTRELLYTGITRAKNQLSLVLASQSVLLQATAARVLRSGGLSEQNPEN